MRSGRRRSAGTPPETTARNRLVLVAGSASLLDSAAIISVGSALPLWQSTFALSDVGVGVVSSIMTVAIAAGALVGGPMADKVGRRRVFTATVGLYAAGATLIALTPGVLGLAVGIAILGVGSGADLPASIALVAARVPASVRGRMVATTHVMWTVGIVLASAAAFAASPFGLAGMRAVFVALGLTALLTLSARRALRDPIDDGTATAPPQAQLVPCTTRRARVLAAIAVYYVLYTLVANTFGSFRTYLLVTVGGVAQTTATGISFFVTVVGLAGTIAFIAIADSTWRRRVYPAAALALVASQALLAVTVGQHLTATVAALVAYALAYPYVGEGLYKVWAQETVTPKRRATFQGVTVAAARAAAALFALVTPTLLSGNPGLLFALLTLFAVAAAFTGLTVVRSTRMNASDAAA